MKIAIGFNWVYVQKGNLETLLRFQTQGQQYSKFQTYCKPKDPEGPENIIICTSSKCSETFYCHQTAFKDTVLIA